MRPGSVSSATLYMLFPLSGAPYSLLFPQLAPSAPLCLKCHSQRVFLWPRYVNGTPHNSLLLHCFPYSTFKVHICVYLLSLLFSAFLTRERCQEGVYRLWEQSFYRMKEQVSSEWRFERARMMEDCGRLALETTCAAVLRTTCGVRLGM